MTSCSVGPSYTPPAAEVPSKWKNQQSQKCEEFEKDEKGEIVYLDHWWQVFNDRRLEELENLALQNNKDLFVAYERLQEARAIMGIAAANFYPQFNLNPLTTNTVELIKNYRNPNLAKGNSANHNSYSNVYGGGGGANNNALTTSLVNPIPFRAHELLYSLPLNMSYEVDLWGKIRDQYASARYHWFAQEKDYEVVMLGLTSSLAIAYYQLRAADAQIDLLLRILKTREKALEINRARYEEEITFYADVTLAEEEVDLALIQYQEISRQRKVLENQIAVLIGAPASEFQLEHLPLKDPPPCIPAGIPSEVLLRRPDVAEAEDNVKSEHALVKEAYSQFYPSLVLTATAGFESPVLREFLSWISRYWSDGVQVHQVVFDGGRLYYNLRRENARFREASGTYQQQVLIAFQEVENALTDLESFEKQHETAKTTAQWAQKTYQLYLDRYLLGVSYYINVTNSERDLLNYELNINSLLGLQYVATIQFIKALGGGW